MKENGPGFQKQNNGKDAQATLTQNTPMEVNRDHLPPLILDPTESVPDFRPAPASPCFCNSGKIFKDCCGSMEADREPPYGVFIFENYIDEQTVKILRDYAEQCSGQRLQVINNKASTPDNIITMDDERRVTERVELGEHRAEVNAMMQSAFIDLAQQCAGVTLDWYEAPDLMRYHPGGFYVKHADSQNIDMHTRTWHKIIDRDLSMLIYLNDDFEGGKLRFDRFNYRVKPKAGMAVLFPSDCRYIHEAESVTSGVRYAIVSWASVQGVKKIGQRPPEPAIFLN